MPSPLISLVLVALLITAAPPGSDDGLEPSSPRTHVSSSTEGDEVVLNGSLDSEGLTDESGGAVDGVAAPVLVPCEDFTVGQKQCDDLSVPADTAPAVPGEPAVTLTDLATVRPAPPTLAGDVPVGYGLLNAPTNVVATGAEQTVTATLFDLPVQVRFVPVGYIFDYGDGASRVSETGGASWQALGVGQFTPTETTHVFHQRGTFTVDVTVAYAPFVNFNLGYGWRPVAGTVTATSGGYAVQIVEARTALVAHDCNEDPGGVGCPAG